MSEAGGKKCEGCGFQGTSKLFKKVYLTNGALTLCQQCLDDINRKNPQLNELLAIIHRDGGHHQDAVGTEQAVKDAHQILARMFTAVEPPKCSTCGKPATCHGTYEGITGYCCDDHCGHGCEDGCCEPVAAVEPPTFRGVPVELVGPLPPELRGG